MKPSFTFFFLLFLTMCFGQGNIGINTTFPDAKLHINGDLILQRSQINLINGLNANVDLLSNKFSFYEVGGVTSNFEISGFTGGKDGRIIIVHNPTDYDLFLKNMHNSSQSRNQISTSTTDDLKVKKGGSVILIYNDANSFWIIIGMYVQGNCPPGMAFCNGNCTLLNIDPDNCGTCGNICSFPNAYSACLNGTCIMGPCNPGRANCNGLASDGCEINLLTSINNCGSCGNMCNFPNAATSCVNGICVMGACNAGFLDCNGMPGDGCEVNTQTNINNCGSCGNVCSFPNASALCVNGVCVLGSCNSGWADCNGLASDGCEVNVQTNINNCGACGNVCSFPNANSACINGTCFMISCVSGWADCNGLESDGCEINVQTNINNCGTCNNVCSFANASATCVNGVCVMGPCNTGFADCNGLTSDGCEVNTQTSTANCGACGVVCVFANGTGACINGSCVLVACNAGFANCNGNTGDGCEINTLTNVNNCGTCGNLCNFPNATALCINGACVLGPCNTGFLNCNGIASDGCEFSGTNCN